MQKPTQRWHNSCGECPLLALSGHWLVHCTCPLSGVKRTCLFALQMSANDPKRTSAVFSQLAALARAMGRPPDISLDSASQGAQRSVAIRSHPSRPTPPSPKQGAGDDRWTGSCKTKILRSTADCANHRSAKPNDERYLNCWLKKWASSK
jgi:hypothetical protein